MGVKRVEWQWPGGKPVAVLLNICLEAWSDGVAPGISPMGNPLPPGVLDTMAISWASYGPKRGIYRLLDVLSEHDVKASVMTNGVIAERFPQAVKEIAAAGHEILSHSYAMDVIPALLPRDEQKRNIARCTALLADASGQKVEVGFRRAARRGRNIRAFSPKRAIAGMVTCSTAICPICRISTARRSLRFHWPPTSTTCRS